MSFQILIYLTSKTFDIFFFEAVSHRVAFAAQADLKLVLKNVNYVVFSLFEPLLVAFDYA
jgi:hypothetical protein